MRFAFGTGVTPAPSTLRTSGRLTAPELPGGAALVHVPGDEAALPEGGEVDLHGLARGVRTRDSAAAGGTG